ncbi:hypothetical protein M9H77_36430 [Catharanthus roseus]|uniref:Uncharacterized protein n=1 Tax=Catharanthus roseus TaxID=4058 RepID=A0ACB9ZVI6_CATRO|nr:hypothetical protein M9H77_36430 [Catharanthus roseus]
MITHIGRRNMLAMWRSGIIYIGNLTNRDTRIIGYQPARVDRWMIIANFAEKVQTIIYRCMPSRRRPREPVPDCGARGVKRGVRRLPGGRARGGHIPAPHHLGRQGHPNPGHGGERGERYGGRGYGDLASYDHVDPLGLTPPAQLHPGGLGTSYAPPPPDTVGSSIQAPLPRGLEFSSFQSPGNRDEHDDEQMDGVTPAQQLGFGHRVVVPSFYVMKLFL